MGGVHLTDVADAEVVPETAAAALDAPVSPVGDNRHRRRVRTVQPVPVGPDEVDTAIPRPPTTGRRSS